MTITQQIEWQYDRDGSRFPVLRLTVDGCHDVGRMLANLARGNCEHGEVAHDAARTLNKTADGRSTLAYLRRHGGPALGPVECEPCGEGKHDECWQREDPCEPCRCFEAGEHDHGADPWELDA